MAKTWDELPQLQRQRVVNTRKAFGLIHEGVAMLTAAGRPLPEELEALREGTRAALSIADREASVALTMMSSPGAE